MELHANSILQRTDKFLHRQVRCADKRMKRTLGNDLVIRHGQRRDFPRLRKNNMTRRLARNGPSKPREGADGDACADYRKLGGHQAITSTCRVSTVKGSPCSARTSRHNRIASAMFRIASSLVF